MCKNLKRFQQGPWTIKESYRTFQPAFDLIWLALSSELFHPSVKCLKKGKGPALKTLNTVIKSDSYYAHFSKPHNTKQSTFVTRYIQSSKSDC